MTRYRTCSQFIRSNSTANDAPYNKMCLLIALSLSVIFGGDETSQKYEFERNIEFFK
jgi:hypothetical protein